MNRLLYCEHVRSSVIGIVVSRADSASAHIGEQLLSVADWTERTDSSAGDGGTYYRRDGFELRIFEEMHLSLDRPDDAFAADLDLLVFVSRHAGDTGSLLTAHFTGNFGPAEYGGDPDSFARACPGAQKAVVAALVDHAPEDYQVGIECTHHGPTAVGVPSMFVELGSGEPQWEDPDGARAVARAVLDLEGVTADQWLDDRERAIDSEGVAATGRPDGGATGPVPRQLVGFGGGHYAPRFERIVRETPWAVGHIGADWALDALGAPEQNRDVIERAFVASGTQYAVLEAGRPELAATIDDLGYRTVSETWVREVADRPLALVDALETTLSTVEDGLRFGDQSVGIDSATDEDSVSDADLATDVEPASEVDPAEAFVVVDLPDELLAKVRGIDSDRARRAVVDHTVAFETEHGGSQAVGRAAVPTTAARDALIDVLVDALESEYDEVERRPAEVIARKQEFDPAKARVLGVPDGPKFGQLAAGQAVEVGDQRISPEAVRSEQVDQFDI